MEPLLPYQPSQTMQPSTVPRAWYRDWFNSPYYHLLYRHRDTAEAEKLITKLVQHLHLQSGANVIDVACGRGRHAQQLFQLGLSVTGIDLSEESVAYAKQHFRGKGVNFVVHDMREPFPVKNFDAAFNLFTSFGYFDTDEQDQLALKQIGAAIRTGGYVVLDYLNFDPLLGQLPQAREQFVEEVTFRTKKYYNAPYLIKEIHVDTPGEQLHFAERVKQISLEQFSLYFSKAGIQLEEVYGNYELDPFDPVRSDRMLLIGRKH